MSERPSLVSSFAASTAVLAASVVVLAGIFVTLVHLNFFKGAIDTTLRGISASLAEVIWQDPDRASEVAQRHALGLVLETPDSHKAFGPDGSAVDPDEQLSVGRRYRRIDVSGPEGLRIVFFWDMVIFARAHGPLLITLLFLLLVMIGATYSFQLRHLRPLQWLHTGVDAVSRGDFTIRVPVARQDEIGRVAEAFNQMTGRVERMMDDRERLLADVSHELRSPLSRINVALELLPDSEKKALIAKDIRQMESLTSVLLEMERVRAWVDRFEGEPVDFAAVVREVVADVADREPEVTASVVDQPVEVEADRMLIGVLVQNLLDNAIKFSLPDSRPVEVSLGVEGDAARLVVDDDGKGIPPEDTERVFEPFVKLDPARGHRRGHGLGLNLCRRIVQALGGTLELQSDGKRGTRAVVRLPIGR